MFLEPIKNMLRSISNSDIKEKHLENLDAFLFDLRERHTHILETKINDIPFRMHYNPFTGEFGISSNNLHKLLEHLGDPLIKYKENIRPYSLEFEIDKEGNITIPKKRKTENTFSYVYVPYTALFQALHKRYKEKIAEEWK